MSYVYANRNQAWKNRRIKNAATNLLVSKEIKLVKSQAKDVQVYVEKIITLAKKHDLNSIRIIKKRIIKRDYKDTGKDVLYHVIHDIAPKYKNRRGGYTRIIKLYNRKGDDAKMVLLQLL